MHLHKCLTFGVHIISGLVSGYKNRRHPTEVECRLFFRLADVDLVVFSNHYPISTQLRIFRYAISLPDSTRQIP